MSSKCEIPIELGSFTLGSLHVEPNTVTHPQYNEPHLVFCLQGDCLEEHSSGQTHRGPASLTLHFPGERLTRTVGAKPTHAIGVRIDESVLKDAPGFNLTHPAARIEALRLAHTLGGRCTDLALSEQICALIASILPPSKRRDSRPTWLSDAEEALLDSFRGPVSLTALARTVAINPVHLARTFKQHNGCTISAYVRQLRLADALVSGLPLAEAASSAGFFDQAHFGRVARTHLGCTPKEFRIALANI